MRHVLMLTSTLFASTLFTSAVAAPLVITPASQQARPGALVVLSASEDVNWSASGGTLGSTRGTRTVLEVPKTGGTITVTVRDPKDQTRKAFAVVQVLAATPDTLNVPWRTRTFAAGASFSAAVSTDGSLWTWGLNDQNQIPGSAAARVSVPFRSEGLSAMTTVSVSKFLDTNIAGVVLAKNGTLWTWGRDHPTPASIDKHVKYVDFTYCLVGSIGDGRYFLTDGNDRVDAPQNNVGYVTSLQNDQDEGGSLALVMQDGSVAISRLCAPGDAEEGPVTVPGLNDVTDISTIGADRSIALRRDGTAVLIDNTTYHEPSFQELAGFSGIRILASNGKRGGTAWGFTVMYDGTVRRFDLDDSGVPSVPTPIRGLTNIVDASVSGSHALFLRQDGTLFAIGLNGDGELGNGTTQDTLTPVEVIGIKVAVR